MASFWFLPGVMAAGAFLVAVATMSADAPGASAALRRLGPPFDIQEDTARETLSTPAGAMVTVVGLVLSLTLVTLTFAVTTDREHRPVGAGGDLPAVDRAASGREAARSRDAFFPVTEMKNWGTEASSRS